MAKKPVVAHEENLQRNKQTKNTQVKEKETKYGILGLKIHCEIMGQNEEEEIQEIH